MKHIRTLSAACILVLFFTNSQAQINNKLQDCLKLADDELRLACYDHIATDLQNQAVETPTSSSKPTIMAEPVKPPSITSKKSTTSHPAEQKITNNLVKSDDFGSEHINKANKTDRVDVIVSPLTLSGDEFTGWNGKTVFQLQNGQTWKQVDNKRFYIQVTKPIAKIERGLFGSYYLNIEGYNSKVRVKRIK